MENLKGLSQRGLLMKELIEGIEVARQLRKQIMSPTDDKNASSREDQTALNHSLIDKMLSSFDKTIAMAKMMGIDELLDDQQPSFNPTTITHHGSNDLQFESPLRDQSSHHPRYKAKKRKTMPRLTKTVQVCGGGSVSEPSNTLEDGFSWRKYGQKAILGAKFPRGYYRCTHRHSQGCAATKQVQRSDEDPSIYQIIYHGDHTCFKGPHSSKAQIPSKPAQINSEPQPQSLQTLQQQYQIAQPPQDEIFLGLGPDGDIKVETENEAHLFSSVTLENWPIDSNFLSCSPAFGSPTTSESNYYFPVSPRRITGFGAGMNIQSSDSDLNEVMSAPNSVTNSPKLGDFEFPLDQLLDIDANFTFEF